MRCTCAVCVCVCVRAYSLSPQIHPPLRLSTGRRAASSSVASTGGRHLYLPPVQPLPFILIHGQCATLLEDAVSAPAKHHRAIESNEPPSHPEAVYSLSSPPTCPATTLHPRPRPVHHAARTQCGGAGPPTPTRHRARVTTHAPIGLERKTTKPSIIARVPQDVTSSPELYGH